MLDHAGLVAGCTVAVIIAAMFALKAQQKLLTDENQALHDQLTSVTQSTLGKAVSDPSEVEALVKNPKLSDPLPRFDAFDALGAVSAAIKADISHEVRRLHVDLADEKRGGQLELQGALQSLGQRDEIVGELGKHPCFRNIELGRTTPTGSDDRINYQIEAALQCPGEGDTKDKKKKASEVEL